MTLPANRVSHFPLAGGLDLVTPAIAFEPGKTFDCLNYEPEPTGGYRRVAGYERFDGRPSPTDTASFFAFSATLTAEVADGATITGASSGKSGKVVGRRTNADGSTLLILSRASATPTGFTVSEQLTVGGLTVGIAVDRGTVGRTAEEDADFQQMAVDDLRTDVTAVPGSGPLRGCVVLDDVVYAFRDAADGKSGNIWRSSPTGWQQVTMISEMDFKQGAVEIKVGETITNGLTGGSAASAFVAGVAKRSGVWHATTDQAVGTLYLSNVTGTWAVGQTIQVGGVTRAVADSAATTVVRAPGGTIEYVRHNFGGANGREALYITDGVNRAAQFDGNYYMPVKTGMTVDRPQHVTTHLNRLWLSFGASIQFSSPGTPFEWTVVTGAGEFSTGDTCTGLLPMGGDAQGAALVIFTRDNVFTLYGTDPANFQLQPGKHGIGYASGTVQAMSGTAFGITARGIQMLESTQAYGDFSFASVSAPIQPLLAKLRGKEAASTVLRSKSQYRAYFSDGTIIVLGLTGDSITGIMPLRYPHPVRCICTHTFSDGRERTFFGSDSGFLYEAEKGTSFDGQPVEFWLRLAFTNQRGPRTRKRFRRAVLELKSDGFCRVSCTYDLGYGNPEIAPPPLALDAEIDGTIGGYWDQFEWDSFRWDGRYVSSPSITLDGTDTNISLVFYGNRAQDQVHVLQGVTLIYADRRIER